MRKLHTRRITGIIVCESNVRVGGSKGLLEIGGDDNPTIKHPVTKEPYLPGSSIKGRMRAGFEQRKGSQDGKPCGCGTCMICRLFGAHMNQRHALGPSRLKIGDAIPVPGLTPERGAPVLETKYEILMDRNKNTAEHPRPNEVIAPGARFQFEMRLEVWDSDTGEHSEQRMIEEVKKGLRQLEEDGLGAAFGRGYGRIRFENLAVDRVPFQLHAAE